MASQFIKAALLFGWLFLATANDTCEVNSTSVLTFAEEDIIYRDVVIIGGGATGTYAAVRLSQDLNTSVVVVEKSGRLGGHTETYIDSITGEPVDYGVQTWLNNTEVYNFTKRFDISLEKYSLTSTYNTLYLNFQTGKALANYSSVSTASLVTALETYFKLVSNYPYLVEGYELPSPVPADLLLPFGDFVTKYSLGAAVQTLWAFAQGTGDLLNVPTIYVIQNIGIPQLDALFGLGDEPFVLPTSHQNSEIYTKASTLLGSNVLYNSTVLAANRQDVGEQEVVVQTSSGLMLIKAKKILITIPTTIDNMLPFGLEEEESSLFSQFNYTTYYTGIIRSGVPNNVDVVNTANGTAYNIPTPPYVEKFSYSGVDGLHTFHTIATTPQTQDEVEALVLSEAAGFAKAGTFNASSPSIAALSNHTPISLRVSSDAISKGFYNSLYALQGQHGTWYTGNTWAGDYTSVLWAFTEALLPNITASLK